MKQKPLIIPLAIEKTIRILKMDHHASIERIVTTIPPIIDQNIHILKMMIIPHDVIMKQKRMIILPIIEKTIHILEMSADTV
jgi:hypothetical protein